MIKSRFLLVLFLVLSVGLQAQKTTKLVILHTNDTHSQVEPVSGKDKGGFARRLGVINKIRSEEKNVLLFDAGDFWQGTPYFNFFGGRVELNALKMMDYDAVTLGNHEFDNGMDSLATVLKEVSVPIVNVNYNVENTPIKDFVKPYIVIKKGGLKIGVLGVGVNLRGLAFQKNYERLILQNPIKPALETSAYLKDTLKCDLVICLSHLGVSDLDADPTDYDLAAASSKIDVIIGGHSHKMIVNETVKNAEGKPVIIAQMGKGGENLGRIDLEFEKKK
ncbi:MAG TPA: bifunctional metallophosphatase/5'-nucleotidase [Bacteroidales bacterium]|nr:bifunctional metallophosphatase/5'-nucleotidase [Bacteroidales bacterium]